MMPSASSVDGKPAPCRIQVAVRLRPPVNTTKDQQEKLCVRGLDKTSLEIRNWRDYTQTLRYRFDAFLDSTSRQQDVYDNCVKPILAKTLQGQNASIFAYGPTGAGKTHTMLGTVKQPGIIPRAVNGLFRMVEKQRKEVSCNQWVYTLSFSYLEIYQEKVYDLLEVKSQDLPIREDRDHTIFIPNLAEKEISSLAQFHDLFVPASKNRTTAATKLNSRSSRSHSILLLKIVKKQCESPFKKQIGKAYLIDLAGSENNKRTGNQGIRLKESGAINTSLFVLGQIVDALNQGLSRIPYRDSKLTRLLQDSLGGSSHTCMITSIAPEEASYMETYTALNFASKSRQIVNRPFTRETVERPNVKVPTKRASGSSGSHPSDSCQQLKRARKDSDENGRRDRLTQKNQRQEPAPFLSPLLKRQAKFEESMRKRLESLETNIIMQLKPAATNQRGAGQSHDQQNQQILQELKQSSKQLSELQKQNSKYHQALSKKKQTSFPPKCSSSGIYISQQDPTNIPRAVIKPLTVSSQPNRISPTTGKVASKKDRAPDVQFMKLKPSKSGVDLAKENAGLLQPNPELQAEHTAKIIQLLNCGSVKKLKSLQSVGEKRAQLIHSWRQMFGDFKTIEDLRNVNGLPSKTVDAIIRNNLLCNAIETI